MTPLYATEEQIAERVFGRGQLRQWKAFAELQERHGLPPIDPITGRRFLPAVLAFLYKQYGLIPTMPSKPDGAETWPIESQRQDSDGGSAATGNIVPIGLRGQT